MQADNAKIQMRKGIIELCVLAIISKGEVYATEIIDCLKTSKLLVVEGTIYPMLNRLKNAGLVTYRWEESSEGPPRKYYMLTKSGKEVYNELLQTWSELEYAVKSMTKTK